MMKQVINDEPSHVGILLPVNI